MPVPTTLLRAFAGATLLMSVLALLPSAAFAAPATATSGVNVRSGAGTGYRVVDRLAPGERVEVEGCRDGWCYITHSGPDGYVSASYLRRNGARMERNFNLNFRFPVPGAGEDDRGRGRGNNGGPGGNGPGGGND